MIYDFQDLKEDIQMEFVSNHLAEILYKQREQDGSSQERFLKKYFKYDIYKKKSGSLSLSQLKRYEKEYKNKSFSTIPKKNSEMLHTVLEKMGIVINELYREELYNELLIKDAERLVYKLKKMGLLDCIEKATELVFAMNEMRASFGFNESSRETLLSLLFTDAKDYLSGRDIGDVIYEDIETRHDINLDKGDVVLNKSSN